MTDLKAGDNVFARAAQVKVLLSVVDRPSPDWARCVDGSGAYRLFHVNDLERIDVHPPWPAATTAPLKPGSCVTLAGHTTHLKVIAVAGEEVTCEWDVYDRGGFAPGWKTIRMTLPTFMFRPVE